MTDEVFSPRAGSEVARIATIGECFCVQRDDGIVFLITYV